MRIKITEIPEAVLSRKSAYIQWQFCSSKIYFISIFDFQPYLRSVNRKEVNKYNGF